MYSGAECHIVDRKKTAGEKAGRKSGKPAHDTYIYYVCGYFGNDSSSYLYQHVLDRIRLRK